MNSIIKKYSSIPYKFKFELQQNSEERDMFLIEILVEKHEFKADFLNNFLHLFNPEAVTPQKNFSTNDNLIGGDVGVYTSNKSIYVFVDNNLLDSVLSVVNKNLSKVERVYFLKQWQSYEVEEVEADNQEVVQYMANLLLDYCENKFAANQRFNSALIPMEKLLLDMIEAPSDQIYRSSISCKNIGYHKKITDLKTKLINNLVSQRKLNSDNGLFFH